MVNYWIMKLLKFTQLLIVIMFFNGCVSTKIVSSWREVNREFLIEDLNKILVVAMFKTVVANRVAEDQMASYLDGKGVVSYQYLNKSFNRNNEEAIRNKIRTDGFDGAITMRLIDVDKDSVYTPSRINTYPGYYMDFSSYYYRNWDSYSTPGYFTTTKTYIVEVNVYSIWDNKIIWTAITKTTDPKGVEKLTNEIASVVYKRMIKDGFLRK